MVKSWGELKDQHQIKNGENERNLVEKKRFKFLIMFLFGACESYFSNPISENITLILSGLYPKNHIHWKHIEELLYFKHLHSVHFTSFKNIKGFKLICYSRFSLHLYATHYFFNFLTTLCNQCALLYRGICITKLFFIKWKVSET